MTAIKKPLLFILIILFALSAISCSFKISEINDVLKNDSNDTSHFIELKKSPNKSEQTYSGFVSPSVNNELDGLNFNLTPYFTLDNALYLGQENIDYLNTVLLTSDNYDIPFSIYDWEKCIRLFFMFDKKDNELVKRHVTNYAKDNIIERQHAASGLLNLLSLRYPISMEGDSEIIEKSNIISDFNEIDNRHQNFVRLAYCYGITDYTVDMDRLFRPFDPLKKSEVISMFYRVFINFGIPVKVAKEEENQTLITGSVKELSAQDAFSNETLVNEYQEYLLTLNKSNKSRSKEKIVLLSKAESIISFTLKDVTESEPVSIEQWQQILHEVFGLNKEKVSAHTTFEGAETLTYDIAAISIFKFYGFQSKKATTKEIEIAQQTIHQFDTARDTDILAQMLSSGLLDGLSEIPGFTPQRPVDKLEVLIIVKRIIEKLK